VILRDRSTRRFRRPPADGRLVRFCFVERFAARAGLLVETGPFGVLPPISAEPAPLREKALASGARDEGSMYHM
jgi:hypothetical protein